MDLKFLEKDKDFEKIGTDLRNFMISKNVPFQSIYLIFKIINQMCSDFEIKKSE